MNVINSIQNYCLSRIKSCAFNLHNIDPKGSRQDIDPKGSFRLSQRRAMIYVLVAANRILQLVYVSRSEMGAHVVIIDLVRIVLCSMTNSAIVPVAVCLITMFTWWIRLIMVFLLSIKCQSECMMNASRGLHWHVHLKC